MGRVEARANQGPEDATTRLLRCAQPKVRGSLKHRARSCARATVTVRGNASQVRSSAMGKCQKPVAIVASGKAPPPARMFAARAIAWLRAQTGTRNAAGWCRRRARRASGKVEPRAPTSARAEPVPESAPRIACSAAERFPRRATLQGNGKAPARAPTSAARDSAQASACPGRKTARAWCRAPAARRDNGRAARPARRHAARERAPRTHARESTARRQRRRARARPRYEPAPRARA